MKTDFTKLRADIRGVFLDDNPPPRLLLFVMFLVPVGTLITDFDAPTHMSPIVAYFAGGIIAWALVRSQPGTHPAVATLEHRAVLDGTAPFAILVLRAGGAVTFRAGEVQAIVGKTTMHTTKHADGSYTVEVKRHG